MNVDIRVSFVCNSILPDTVRPVRSQEGKDLESDKHHCLNEQPLHCLTLLSIDELDTVYLISTEEALNSAMAVKLEKDVFMLLDTSDIFHKVQGVYQINLLQKRIKVERL